MSSNATVRDYLKRLVPLQGMAEDNRDRLNEIRREARADGLNFDAVNALLPLLTKYPHDKAAGVLNEVIRYAEAFGTEPLVSQADTSSHPPPEPVPDAVDSQPTRGQVPPLGAVKHKSRLSGPLRLSTQVVAAMSVSVGLLWLLN